MKVSTSRFGNIDVDDSAVITMLGGLIGFPQQIRYVVIRHNPESPFYWLQAVDDPDLAFVIVDPLVFKPDYQVPTNKEVLESLKAASAGDISFFVIVTIPPGNPEGMTANLLGPLVFNTQTRLARQLVLDERRYSHRYPILSEDPQQKGGAGEGTNSK